MRQQREEAFDAAFERLRRRAYRVAYRLLGDDADAQEIAAEALARAYSRWRTVADHAEPWVVTVATNLALDRGRRDTRARRHRAELAEPVGSLDRYAEERLDLQQALRALPQRQREVVALRFLADWSAEDVAFALGLSVGTVKSHTSRGLQRLRTLVVQEVDR
ncbi:MAG TPA: sigma-70 family RNA polymerase sigma factor [Mycobacteriales bacterium]